MKPSRIDSVGAFEAKNRLSELLNRVSQGERIWITKRGKRVAMLSSGREDEARDAGEIMAAFHAIRGRSNAAGPSIKSLVEEGRR